MRSSWSNADSKSCRSFNSSSSGSSSWKGCSSSHHKICTSHGHRCCKVPRPRKSSCRSMVTRLLRGSALGGLSPSRLSQGGRLWRLRVPCAHRKISAPRSKVPFMVLRESPWGSLRVDGRGILMPVGQTRLGPLAAVKLTRPGLGGQWMTMGGFPPSLICSYTTGARSRPCKNSSGVLRRARWRRWSTGA